MHLERFSTFFLDIPRVTLRGPRAIPATRQWEKRLSSEPSSCVFTTTAFFPAWRPASTMTTFPLSTEQNQEEILSIHIWKEVSYVHANKGNKGFAKTNKTLGTKYFQVIDQKKEVFPIGKIICWLDLIYGYNDNYSFSSQDYIKRRIVSWFIVLQNTANCDKSGKDTLMLRAPILNYPIPYSPQSSPSVTESIRSNPNAAYFFQVW